MLTCDEFLALFPTNPAQSATRTPVLITALPHKQESFAIDQEAEEAVKSEPAEDVQSIPKTEPDITEDLEEVIKEEESATPNKSADVMEEEEEEEDVTVKTETDKKAFIYDTTEDEEQTVNTEEVEASESEQVDKVADATEDEDVTFPTESDDDMVESLQEDNAEAKTETEANTDAEEAAEEEDNDEVKETTEEEEVTFGDDVEDGEMSAM